MTSFADICRQVCERFGRPPPETAAPTHGIAAFSLQLDGVDVTLSAQERVPDELLVHVDLGPVPANHAAAAWNALMEANYLLLGDGGPSFARNIMSGDALLQHAVHLGEEGAVDHLLEALADMVSVALRWRQDHFLDPATRPWPAREPLAA